MVRKFSACKCGPTTTEKICVLIEDGNSSYNKNAWVENPLKQDAS